MNAPLIPDRTAAPAAAPEPISIWGLPLLPVTLEQAVGEVERLIAAGSSGSPQMASYGASCWRNGWAHHLLRNPTGDRFAKSAAEDNGS